MMEKRKGHAAFGAKVIMRCKWYIHKISMIMASNRIREGKVEVTTEKLLLLRPRQH